MKESMKMFPSGHRNLRSIQPTTFCDLLSYHIHDSTIVGGSPPHVAAAEQCTHTPANMIKQYIEVNYTVILIHYKQNNLLHTFLYYCTYQKVIYIFY